MSTVARFCFFFLFCWTAIYNVNSQELNAESIAHIDKLISKLPKKRSKTPEDLAAYINETFTTDLEKVRAVYTWIGTNIRYDLDFEQQSDKAYNHDPLSVFDRKEAVCTGYANLFKYIIQLAEIQVVTISGYSKSGRTFMPGLSQPDHVWNAVYVDSSWHLLDVTWESGLWRDTKGKKSVFGTRYFLITPEQFIQDHLPAMPMWQLLQHPIHVAQFKNDMDVGPSDSLLRSSGTTPEIDRFLSLIPEEQRLFEYEESYEFNPTMENGGALGHGLLDYAGVLSDSIDDLSGETGSEETVREYLIRLIDICNRADQLVSFHDWQARMYADALVALTIDQYNTLLDPENRQEISLEHLQSQLQKALELIRNTKSDYWTKSAENECLSILEVIENKMNREK